MCATVYGWLHLVKATEVTAGLGGWLEVTCGLTDCTQGSAPGSTLGNECGKNLFRVLSMLAERAICFTSSLRCQ